MNRRKTIEEVLAEAKGKPLPKPSIFDYASITIKALPDMILIALICTVIGMAAGAILHFLFAICAFAWELLSELGDLQTALIHMRIDRKWRGTGINDAMFGLGFTGLCFGMHGAWKRLMYGVRPSSYIRGVF